MHSCILQKIPSPSPLFFRDKSSHRGEMHKNDDTLHKAAKPAEISCMSGDPVKKAPPGRSRRSRIANGRI